MDQATAAPAWPRRDYAWYVLALLTLAYALAILDRVSIALLIVPLEKSLHISDTQFGLLQGFAFSAVYSILGLPLGLLVDRKKRAPVMVAGMSVSPPGPPVHSKLRIICSNPSWKPRLAISR